MSALTVPRVYGHGDIAADYRPAPGQTEEPAKLWSWPTTLDGRPIGSLEGTLATVLATESPSDKRQMTLPLQPDIWHEIPNDVREFQEAFTDEDFAAMAQAAKSRPHRED